MKNNCEEKFFKEVEKLLKKSVNEWEEFKHLWGLEEYRKAYLLIYDLIESNKVCPSDSYRKISEEFYWLYIA